MIWHTEPLGDLVEVLDHRRVPVSASIRAKRLGDVPYYGATGQVGWIDEALFNEELVLLGEDGVQFFDPLRPKSYIIKGPSWVNNHAHVLRVGNRLTPQYLKLYLDAFDYAGFAGGTTRLKLTKSAMLTIPVSFPDLDDQRAMVGRLEERLSRVEAGERYVQGARKKLRLFKNGLLQAAVDGRLVKCDDDHRSARDELVAAGVSPDGLREEGVPPGWTLCRIGDLAQVGSGATPKRGNQRYWAEGDVPWVTSGQLSEPYVRSAAEFITRAALTETAVKLWPPHTLLVAMYGEGRTRGLCSELLIEATTNQACAAIVLPTQLSMLQPWLKLFLTASYERNRRLASGGVQPNLSLGLIKSLMVPIPPSTLRAAILAEVDRQTSLCEAAERAAAATIRRGSVLRRSLVTAVMTGGMPTPPSSANERTSA